VFLRKSSGSLDLLTEAQVLERFPRLRLDLPALYAAYYIAELLGDWTEDYDPHPHLFEEALATLRSLGEPAVDTGLRLARFELVMLRELGYHPVLEACVACGDPVTGEGLVFSPRSGGVVCPRCRTNHLDGRALSPGAWGGLIALTREEEGWKR